MDVYIFYLNVSLTILLSFRNCSILVSKLVKYHNTSLQKCLNEFKTCYLSYFLIMNFQFFRRHLTNFSVEFMFLRRHLAKIFSSVFFFYTPSNKNSNGLQISNFQIIPPSFSILLYPSICSVFICPLITSPFHDLNNLAKLIMKKCTNYHLVYG